MPRLTRSPHPRLRSLPRLLLGAALTLQAGLVQPLLDSASQARAEQSPKTYRIAPGPLGAALNQFARDAGVVLSFESGLQGRFSVDQGFALLLSGTGLEVLRSGNNYLVTQKAGTEPALQLDATSVNADRLGDITEGTGSYTTGTVTAGGKTPTALREIAQSVSVITRQRIEDQGLNNVEQVLKQTPGLTLVGGNDNDVQIYSRGFKLSSMTTDSGAPSMREETYQTLPDMIQYDHVEVLRGSDGMNTGNGEPGGTVNLIRKRALNHTQVKVASSAGSWANYRQEIDVTGPMGLDGKLRGRFAAAYEDRDYFYHGANSQKQAIFGVLKADLTPDTLLTFGSSYEKRDMDGYWDQGLVRSSSGEDLGLSRKTSLAADWSSANNERLEAFSKLEQAFGEQWKGELSYTYSKFNTHHDLGQVTTPPNLQNGTDATFQRILRDYENLQQLFAANLHGTFEALGREHELLIGADHENIHRMYADHSTGTQITPVDLYATDISALPKGSRPGLLYTFPTWDAKKTGGYITLKAQLADPLKLIVGARYNDYEDALFSVVPDGSGGISTYTSGGKDTGNITYYGGLVYDLDPNWSLYTSYSEIYQPQTSMLSASFGSIAPIEGKTSEVGIKSAFYNGRLNFSSALYYVNRENEGVYLGGPSTAANSCCYINGGEIVSRGWDTELSGELLPGWELSAGYTFNMNEYRASGTADNVGKPLSSQTPKHLFKFHHLPVARRPGTLEGRRGRQHPEPQLHRRFDHSKWQRHAVCL